MYLYIINTLFYKIIINYYHLNVLYIVYLCIIELMPAQAIITKRITK